MNFFADFCFVFQTLIFLLKYFKFYEIFGKNVGNEVIFWFFLLLFFSIFSILDQPMNKQIQLSISVLSNFGAEIFCVRSGKIRFFFKTFFFQFLILFLTVGSVFCLSEERAAEDVSDSVFENRFSGLNPDWSFASSPETDSVPRSIFGENNSVGGFADSWGMGTSFFSESAEMGGEYRAAFVPTITDNSGMTYPRETDLGLATIHSGKHSRRRVGANTVHILEGGCRLVQGKDSFQSEKMVVWVGPLQFNASDESTVYPILVYLEENVEISFVTSRTTSRVKGRTWAGRLSSEREPLFLSEAVEDEKEIGRETNELYVRGEKAMFRPARLLLTQWKADSAPQGISAGLPTETEPELPIQKTNGEVVAANQTLYSDVSQDYAHVLSTEGKITAGDVSAFDPNSLIPGSQKISFYQRNDVDMNMHFLKNEQTGRTIVIFNQGVTLLIDGEEKNLKEKLKKDFSLDKLKSLQIGTIDISADRLVLWSDSDISDLSQDHSLDVSKVHLELYLEGNIIFRQGEQEIYAERMYFDVSTRRGLIREAEVFATIPNAEGLIRLRAEEIRIPNEGEMVANDAFVTTSRIGDPLYRFQMGQLMLQSQKMPRKNPFTGQVQIDPTTGEPIIDAKKKLVARRTMVKVGDAPIFYLPYFAAPMDSPSQIINKFSIRNDSIFGFQPMIGVDAYRLFGIERPWKGTSWDLNGFYYTKRGPGMGTEFSYDRRGEGMDIPLGPLSGKGKGNFEFWGIYDTGEDNLGLDRRHLTPEKEFRYQIFGRHRGTFGNDWELRFQLGILSDRNFQEEYFQRSWYEEPDRATQIEIRKSEENKTLSLWADVRTNDFHTQTERIPQLDFYWLGQPLLNDALTWNSYSQIGYVHLFPDTAPKDPNDRALWRLLSWEEERKGIRTSTRHEISYPFQLGSVKLVPFALGEIAYWGEDLQGEDASRVYGQAGFRATLPMWRYFNWQNRLFNVNGIMHKIEFDVEAMVAGADKSVDELPLYDLPDDRSLLDFSHHMSSTIFNGLPIPEKYQLRSYAVRSNLGGWVTANTELADDLALIRFGMHHRWQTKRGMPGKERIIDWITFDTNFNIYPDPDRDNFGAAIGLLDYDLRWYPGDRLMLYSSGMFDFFSDGIRMVDIGAVMDRPGKGSVFTSLHYLTGCVENVVMRIGFNYRMSEKWTSTFVSTFDVSGKGNIGEGVSLTRVGESFLFTTGLSYDAPSDNFSIHFALEPRFGKKGNTARLFNIAPPGVDGID